MIWATHFTACYVWAAMACGRFAGGFDHARTGITAITIVACIAIAVCLVYGFHRHERRLPTQSNDDGTSEDRRRFMAFTTMLLAALSLIATAFVGGAAIAAGGCV